MYRNRIRKKFTLTVISLCITLIFIGILLSRLFYSSQDLSNEQLQWSFKNATLLDHLIKGSLTYDQWICPPFVGYYIDDLRLHHHDWPNHPTIKTNSNKAHIVSQRVLHFGGKMYGYLLPPVTGNYQFILRDLSNAIAFSAEVWISLTPSPLNLVKVFNITKGGIHFNRSSTAFESFFVNLNSEGHYFEIHFKSFKGVIDIELLWRQPNENDEFHAIPSSVLASLPYFNSTNSSTDSSEYPSDNIQSHRYIKPPLDNASQVITLDVLPSCNYTPSHVTFGPVEHFKGYYKVRESAIYPWDMNKYVYIKSIKTGNLKISKSIVELVSKLYRNEFVKKQTGHSVVGIHYLEETKDKSIGSRYLLEMDIKLNNGEIKHISEYVFLPKKNMELCHVINFQWKQNIFVYVIVSVKNLRPWIVHLIHNMEDIYLTTGDSHFELVIVDYSSTDININQALTKSSLPYWKVISLEGQFSRSAGLQAGIEYVKDVSSIVMTIDMHLTLPLDFITSIRKHTIQGRLAYAPMFFKLEQGYTENNVNGYWQIGTYGLFGMYKSDWRTVGGFDVITYKYKWGGEDWDLLDRTVSKGIEVYRVRPPGLFHYYHTRAGMWGVRSNTNHNC